ncbi:enoyl-CoA hydratase-related protein [Rhodococcus globerulus]|uniref:Enoyl-CoA hydratase-related protein n=1 Tax=Rhodococcus globerulus TaxID=33008 RepID=A0ABU4BXS7_RHOGO|nr:enoyl-CoA hydratase-related protein [Rhodococcus globerulus]MDV6268968.1 enoyl-CoA hydratase-related protein [Rhodococcus globerulus]
MSDLVQVDIHDNVGVVTLNRPHRKNAWTVPMQREYFDALQTLTDDPRARVLVLTGAGGSFCPGADTEALSTYTETGTTNPEAETIAQPEWFPITVPKAVIAAIEGPCAGIGLVQALQCDIRIASPAARFSTAFSRRALPPMHGAVPLLERVAGAATAAELLLTGRTFDGREAAHLGVVHHLADDPLGAAIELAHDMASHCSPASLARIKSDLWAPHLDRIATAVEQVDAILPEVLSSADFREGVASFVERRAPRFSPLPGEFERTS